MNSDNSLLLAPIERLFEYARHCLENAFNKSGFVLQDIVNKFGRRLEFDVEDGLYQGRRNSIGHDGIWRARGEPDLIIEVKTTDYVTVRLETIGCRSTESSCLAETRVPGESAILT